MILRQGLEFTKVEGLVIPQRAPVIANTTACPTARIRFRFEGPSGIGYICREIKDAPRIRISSNYPAPLMSRIHFCIETMQGARASRERGGHWAYSTDELNLHLPGANRLIR